MVVNNGLGDTESLVEELEPSVVSGFGFALGGILLSVVLLSFGGSEVVKKKLKG